MAGDRRMERPTGVILAAGRGRRMGPLGACLPKACMPVCNRPLMHYHLDVLAGMGIRDVVVVVGHLADVVEQTTRAYPYGHRLHVRFVEQPQPRGIADAVMCVRPLVAARLVVLLADTYFVAGDTAAALAQLDSGAAAAVLSVRRVRDPERIRQECTIALDEAGHLRCIEEKPAVPWNDWKPCGLYFFGDAVFDAIARTPPSALRGEIELSSAVQTLVDCGHVVGCAPAVRWDRNVNTPADLLAVNLAQLRRRGAAVLRGREATVHVGAALDEVVLGDRCHITAPARLRSVIVLPGTVVDRPASLQDCVIGPGYVLDGSVRASGRGDFAEALDGY